MLRLLFSTKKVLVSSYFLLDSLVLMKFVVEIKTTTIRSVKINKRDKFLWILICVSLYAARFGIVGDDTPFEVLSRLSSYYFCTWSLYIIVRSTYLVLLSGAIFLSA